MRSTTTWLSLVLLAVAPAAYGQSANACDQAGEAPDVIVTSLYDTASYGSVGGVSAFALGTVACNIGTCWLLWFASNSNHPVIGQNMFRLKNGRFEQIGQSWVKHVFYAGNEPCSGCIGGGGGEHLNVGCGDTYNASLNGTHLGPKFEVNAHLGYFPYPPSPLPPPGNGVISYRLQVHNADLDPLLNAGALYYGEAQFVAPDDAAWNNDDNNASWSELSVSGSGGSFTIALSGASRVGQPAIQAWKVVDPSVSLADVSIPGEGRLFLAGKATSLGGGLWHYEYAVQNLNSHRSGRSFSVPIPAGATVTNVGFHDVDYHSNEPFAGTDWSYVVGMDSVEWTTQTYAQNPNANALRWGTLYNFRFDANVPPATYPVTIGLFRPGTPSTVSVSTVAPDLCNHNGTCDPAEDPCQCPGDCPPGLEICTGGVDEDCDGSTDCADQDCRMPGATEASCGNGIDDDCDGTVDCPDRDCCGQAACASAPDNDGDLHRGSCDCNDANAAVYPGAPQLCDGINNDCLDPGWPALPAAETDSDGDARRACADCDEANSQVWATPGEVPLLVLFDGPIETALFWTAAPGGTSPVYDAIRSTAPVDFTTATCLVADSANRSAIDAAVPAPGICSCYLVRARNACPMGNGSWGAGSNGTPRNGPTCP